MCVVDRGGLLYDPPLPSRETAMHREIELGWKKAYWSGSNGVVIDINALTYLIDDATKTVSRKEELHIRISGVDVPAISASMFKDSPAWSEGSALTREQVCEWAETTGLISEWGEEVVRYQHALSLVDLPCKPQEVRKRYLSYSLTMGTNEAITLKVGVDNKVATITARLQEVDGKSISIGHTTITGPVTVDTLKTAVWKVLDKYVDTAWGLMKLPMVEKEQGHYIGRSYHDVHRASK